MLDKKIQDMLILNGRAFMRGYREDDPYEESFESDQELKLPQPPLVKAAATSKENFTARNRTVGAPFEILAGTAYRDRCFLNAVKCNFDHQLVCPAFVDCMLFEHIDIAVAACGPGF